MPDPIFNERLETAWEQLLELNAERARTEHDLESGYRAACAEAERRRQETVSATEARFKQETSSAEETRRRTRKEIETRHRTDMSNTVEGRDRELSIITEKATHSETEGRKKLDEEIWLCETVYEAHEDQPRIGYEQRCRTLDGQRDKLRSIRDEARDLLARVRQKNIAEGAGAGAAPEVGDDAEAPDGDSETLGSDALANAVGEAQGELDAMAAMRMPGLFSGIRLPLLIVALTGAAAALAGWRGDWQWTTEMLAIPGAVAVLAGGLGIVLYFVARAKLRPRMQSIGALIERGDRAHAQGSERAEVTLKRHEQRLIDERDADIRKARETYEPILAEIEQRRKHHIERINAAHVVRVQALEQRREEALAAVEAAYEAATSVSRREREEQLAAHEAQYDGATREKTAAYETDWETLKAAWRDRATPIGNVLDEAIRQSAALFPAWDEPSWRDWTPPDGFADAIRFGDLHVDVASLEGGLSEDERLPMPWPAHFAIPATLAFPDDVSLLIEHGADGGAAAIETLHTAMFRLLTTLPPGKVRFTIIDPVGLGQNFAGFMHLADAMEALVTDRIWTETRHIEQRLTDLTEHMETVIQKYLRNEYETIADYNEHAGEIAEPFRFLVIAGFPVSFSESAAKRLASIINSGARCGVYTLIAMDTRQPPIKGVELTDMRRRGVRLVHENGRFTWADRGFATLPLRLDPPPPAEFMVEKLREVGEAAKDSSRVEVPFETIVPSRDDWWTARTDDEISVPLGRSGARSLQHLALGHGTSQHVLIAGKTGSGKSTLLHVLITSVATWFSPDQVELYLVDFKKGVEFKPYATHHLPHARAVAIESDREFGLSVLQRLDTELKRRGDLFRRCGVQDLAGYRAQGHDEAVPRSLLIIDEFQELFVEDDKIAQDAALLLDRLVRQGRAFGIHVILGSQTLGGAYSLAKSTMGQMGVRIALQCSEADSYMIMNEDNSAARLLSRPGEAIYNDSSGTVEGNSPFQIVWLADEERETYLNRINELAAARSWRPPEPQIVFEGNVASDVTRNRLLSDLLAGRSVPGERAPARAWLGEPVAIREPTAAVFRRQSGSNLIIVGQQDEAALAMISVGMVSLGAGVKASGNGEAPMVRLADGTPADSPFFEYLPRVAERLPMDARTVGRRDMPQTLQELAAIVERRQEADIHDAPPVFLVIFGLQRFRDLRQSDEFNFSTDDDGDAAPKPDKLFADLLRDGPAVGVHTLTWCDTATNVDRALGRQLMREFDMRVVLQMSAIDSTNLIDNPLANKLGLRHALFYSDERGTIEKFRPYGVPEETWLESVGDGAAMRE